MQFINLQKQYSEIQADIQTGINNVLNHGQFILGPEVEILEKKLAEYVGTKHCITVANGTDALLIAMMALNIKPQDEVITSPFTFIANAEMIALLGAKPIFVDIDPDTYLIDPKKIESAITDKTKCIMPINLYGQCADMDSINAIANHYDLSVIEDAAQSFGATYKGKKSCHLSTIGCTSFFPSKPLGCYGDGGACFTKDDDLAIRIRQISGHGQQKKYYHTVLGLNSRLDTLQAAILLAKLRIFEDEVKKRHAIGLRYHQLLQGKVKTMQILPYNSCVYAQYTIQTDHRDKICEDLKKANIPTAIHYPLPLHMQPVFAKNQDTHFPHAEYAAKRVMSLPMHPYLTHEEQDYIVHHFLLALQSELA